MNSTLNNFFGQQWLQLVLRYLIGFIFLYAAVEKIAQPEEFARAIMNYKILPLFSVNIAAIIFPWIELLAGLGLIARVQTRANALLIAAMLVIFSIAIAIALVRGLDISCGCFGTASASKVGLGRLFEDIAMLVSTLPLLLAKHDLTSATL